MLQVSFNNSKIPNIHTFTGFLSNLLGNNKNGIQIIPIISGETIFPKVIPNLNQSLFKGVRILDFNNPNITQNSNIH